MPADRQVIVWDDDSACGPTEATAPRAVHGFSSAAESLAHALNLSLRSLHRQLRDEGTSLQKLKDESRRNLAVERLERTAHSGKQIAHDVGFRSEQSFRRAFKQMDRQSPGGFRRRTLTE